jgi:predicted acyltransferase (DUF342 family)
MASNLSVVGDVSVLGVTSLSNALFTSAPISSESTLSVLDTASFSNPVFMASNLSVSGDVSVLGVTSLSNALFSSSSAYIESTLVVKSTTEMFDTVTMHSNLFVGSNLSVTGATALADKLSVAGEASFSNPVYMASNLSVSGDVSILGVTSLSNALFSSSPITTQSTLQVDGAAAFNSDVAMASNLDVGSNLSVTGATVLADTIAVAGIASFSNAIFASSNLSVEGQTGLIGPVAIGTSNIDSNVALSVVGNVNIDGVLYNNGSEFVGLLSNEFGNYINSNMAFGGEATAADRVLIYNESNEGMSFSNALGKTTLYAAGAGYLGVGVPAPLYTLDVAGDIHSMADVHVDKAAYIGNPAGMAERDAAGAIVTPAVESGGMGVTVNSHDSLTASTGWDVVTIYNENTNLTGEDFPLRVSLSNSTGVVSIGSYASNLGIQKDYAEYTLDVGGDINFSGTLYQNGAVYSGWESNAVGNYINSNAAFGGEATASDRVLMYNAGGEAMSFSNASGKTSLYAESNYLGLGIAAPAYTLDVAGTTQAVDARVLNKLYVASNIGIAIEAPGYPLDVQANFNGVSINCSAKVLATEFTIYSDRRIKEDVRSVDIDAHLESLSRIRVCRFAYVDKAEKGAMYKTGLIAQEVEAVLPECVSTVSGYIPDVMKTCAISPVVGDELVYELACGAAGFAAAVGTSFKLRASDVSEGTFYGKVIAVTMSEAAADGAEAEAVAVSATISVTQPLDASMTEVFVVGRHTDDLKMLNFEQLTTITIGALQSQEARLRALEARFA